MRGSKLHDLLEVRTKNVSGGIKEVHDSCSLDRDLEVSMPGIRSNANYCFVKFSGRRSVIIFTVAIAGTYKQPLYVNPAASL